MRRIGVTAAFLILGAIAFGPQAFAATRDQSEDAVAYQINLAHTGAMDFAAGFAPPLVKAWTTNLGNGENIYSALVAKNTVFVNANGVNIFALDLSTGQQKWEHQLDCCGEQGAYDNGRLFFLSDSGELTALSAKTGDQLWQIQLTGEWSFPAPPIAAGGQVFLNGEGSNAIAYSVKEKNGRLLWSQNITGAGLPSLADGGLFLTSGCFYYRLNPADGSIIWTNEQCVGGGWASSAYAHKRLYVSGIPTGNMVDANSGAVIGTFPTWQYPPVLFTDVNGKARGLSLNDSTIDCWNAKTGEVVWQFSSENGLSTPLVVNGVVYVGDAAGTLYALDSKNGKKFWSDDFGGPPYAPGLTAGENTLVLVGDTEVIAYRPQ